jgi:tetratricopeptide (TPR) repeat protein
MRLRLNLSLGELFVRATLGMLLLAVTATGIAAPSSGNTAGRARPGSSAETAHAQVHVWQDTIALPTYEEGPPDINPPFDQFVTNGRYNYPYTMRENLSDHSSPRRWRALNLENEYLKCVVLPDLGGHLYRCLDKRNGADMFYANPSLKFARIAYRGAWAAYGIEFNFPVSHNWMTASPVDFATSTAPDGSATIWVKNIDRVYGMEWCVELTLRPGRAALEQKTTLYNPSRTRHRFYWWTNAGVQVWDDTRLYYPTQFTIFHGFTDVDTWPVNRAGVDLSIVRNHKDGPVSRFSYASNEPFMGVYHPRTNAGVVHYSSRSDLPSRKIFSWGNDADGLQWREALSDNHSAYIEIQAGLFRDQETYGFLDPQQSIHFTEYWLPIRDIGGVTRANPDAVLFLSRTPSENASPVALEVALNVTRTFANAKLVLSDGTSAVAAESVSLSPNATYRNQFPDLPADKTYSIVLTDEAGEVILSHSEGRYDFVPRAEVRTELPPAYEYPAIEKRSEGNFLELGADQERNGMQLEALATYRAGLNRFPHSVPLTRSLGRLEVALKQFSAAIEHLSSVMERVSNDQEASYYLGIAHAANGQLDKARRAFEVSEQFGAFRPASLYELAALDARQGRFEQAHQRLAAAAQEFPEALRLIDLDITLLRLSGNEQAAKDRLAISLKGDPANSFLRYESARLGQQDETLWAHLAADPERILEIAVQYMHFGLYAEAVEILARDYPTGSGVDSEPGMPSPQQDPLIAYYRGYCRELLHQDAADFAVASRLPTTYVFPNRPESFDVLKRALTANSGDANAHALLGSLYMSGGIEEAAMTEWEAARTLNPAIPALLRNMGYTVLYSKGSPERAAALFIEGTRAEPTNAENYLGLEKALRATGRSPEERAAALQKYPGQSTPAQLVFQLARDLAEAGRFEEAQRALATHFVSRQEGGASRTEVYVEIKVLEAKSLAQKNQCGAARTLLQHLTDPVAQLSLTNDALALELQSKNAREAIGAIDATCPK